MPWATYGTWVTQRGEQLGLTLEVPLGLGRGSAPEQLERHGLPGEQFLGAVDSRHTTAASHGLQAESAAPRLSSQAPSIAQ
jgi:hypothetical protein